MKLKRINRFIVISTIIFGMIFTGCSSKDKDESAVTDKPATVTDESEGKDVPDASDKSENNTDISDDETDKQETDDQETGKDEPVSHEQKLSELSEYFFEYSSMEQAKKNESHYKYNMKALSVFDKNCEYDDIETYWYDFLDAVSQGRTSFKCPNSDVYRYIEQIMIMWNLPGADEWIEMQPDPEINNGMASFSYKISDEERKEKLDQIKTVTESVLNEVLEDDYTDFEKALALYIYFVDNFTYVEDWDTWGGIMHVLTSKQGICDEFARAYAYLLVQAGVDATTVGDNGHRWSFVKIGDKYFHVDTTWGLQTGNLMCFMQTTTKKLEESGDDILDMRIDKQKDGNLKTCGLDSEDDYFAPLWSASSRIKWDRDGKKIYIGEPDVSKAVISYEINELDYSGYLN